MPTTLVSSLIAELLSSSRIYHTTAVITRISSRPKWLDFWQKSLALQSVIQNTVLMMSIKTALWIMIAICLRCHA